MKKFACFLALFVAQPVLGAEPDATALGLDLSLCAYQAIPKYDDGARQPAVVAHQAVASCPEKAAALRNGMRQVVARNANPDAPEYRQLIDQHMARLTKQAEDVIADEVVKRRNGKQ